ncbi:hypothetical protein J7J00_17675 [Bacillus sp. ISL-4]|uniref:hypothetical protein n=1 Tax=Bacillus sp. ISL-4 TaxID=2819125 RepID=UPI001BEBF2D5|nr:hypothetical protein [Bacillus sp. ISL-4]MBT2667312.1 hypothetical protein [Bacillus sp. ISL-4]MBT2674188.1 hypothetical protein [Streptomyces sp. ISL-14]
MIKLFNLTQEHSNNLRKNGIEHQFAFGQIVVPINLSPDNRVNEAMADMIKKLAGLQSHSNNTELVMKMDSLININNLYIKEPKIITSHLVDKFFKYCFESNNRAQCFSRFRSKHNLHRYGIFPAIKSKASEEILMSSNLEDMVSHDGLIFSFTTGKDYDLKKAPTVLQHDLNAIKTTPLIQWYFGNIDKLKDNELLWFMTNIISYKNAKVEIRNLTKRNSRIAYYYKLALDVYPEPLSYKKIIGDGLFPYDYLYQAVNSPIVQTMRVSDPEKTVTQEEIAVQLKDIIRRFVEEEGEKIMLLRVDTGSGKTSTVGDFFSSNMAYVGPTHKLIKQFMEDVKKRNNHLDIVYVPQIKDEDIPECRHKKQMKYHEKRGEWKKVQKYRNKAIAEYGTPNQQQLLSNYKEALEKKDGSPFITHSRLIGNGQGFFNGENYQNVETIIIDEDILPSLFPSSVHGDKAVIKNVKSIIKLVKGEIDNNGFGENPASFLNTKIELHDALQLFIKQINQAKVEGILKNSAQNIFKQHSGVLKSYIKNSNRITLDMFSILTCEVLTSKNHSKWPITIYTQDYSHVLQGKKLLVMSATLDKNVHLELFRKRLNVLTDWVDMPRTEIKGEIVCHTEFSTTKSSLTKNPDRIELINKKIKEIGCIDHVITYKDWKSKISSVNENHMHFYNTAGYNDYSGKNLAIVGTPNNIPESTVTLHYLIYRKVPKSLRFEGELLYDLSNRAFFKDEFKFSFFTFRHKEDEKARAIHIWSTYNELLQAVGRARLTHHDCSVHVFSRLPIPQCKFSYEVV